MPELPPMVTAQQAADMLGVNVVTVHRWAASGRLPAVIKLTTATLFLLADVEVMADALKITRGGVRPDTSAAGAA